MQRPPRRRLFLRLRATERVRCVAASLQGVRRSSVLVSLRRRRGDVDRAEEDEEEQRQGVREVCGEEEEGQAGVHAAVEEGDRWGGLW